MERIYNDDLRKLKERRGANKLISNIDKIICIVFTTTHKEFKKLLKLDENEIKEVHEAKYLGVILYNKLVTD